MRTRNIDWRAAAPKRERGVVLIAALIALVAMTLAALALVRSLDTGLTIAGNMAFRTVALMSGDIGADYASGYLRNNPHNLLVTGAASGYYASWNGQCDTTGNRTPAQKNDDIQWDPSGALNFACGVRAAAVPAMPSGYAASYVIMRTCECEGRPGAPCPATGLPNICSGDGGSRFHGTPDYVYNDGGVGSGGGSGGGSGSTGSRTSSSNPYYRAVARVVGPRNTIVFVEQVVSLQ